MVKRQGKVNKLVIMTMGIVRNIHSEKKANMHMIMSTMKMAS